MKKIISLSAVFGLLPFLASAATVESILDTVGGIIGTLIPILIALAVVYFIWGVIQYTLSSDEEAKKKAKSGIIQGLIGLFVIVAFWGIIAIVQNTFDIKGNNAPYVDPLPELVK